MARCLCAGASLARCLVGAASVARCVVAAVRPDRRIVAATEKALGPDHPAVAAALVNLAAALGNTGDLRAALPMYERALAILERALPADHPFTATCLLHLSETFAWLGDIRDSIRTGSLAATWSPRPTVHVTAALAHQARTGSAVLGTGSFKSNSVTLSASAQF